MTPQALADAANALGYDSIFRISNGMWRCDHRDGIGFTDLSESQLQEKLSAQYDDDIGIDERDDPSNPYCDCGAIPTQDEEDSGVCSCCGKIVEWAP